MSHKGPLWVPDYDNIRKCRKEEVSAGSWPPGEGLWTEITLIFPRSGGVTASGTLLMSQWLPGLQPVCAPPDF